MKKTLAILIPIFVCVLVGFSSSRFQLDSLLHWYPTLHKPALTPPNLAFPIAWSILYVCMGISIGLIVAMNVPKKKCLITLFAIQLCFNFTWSIAFFYLQNPILGLVNILILEALLIYYAIQSYTVSKASSILFFPYILWVGFATYLNFYIWLYN